MFIQSFFATKKNKDQKDKKSCLFYFICIQTAEDAEVLPLSAAPPAPHWTKPANKSCIRKDLWFRPQKKRISTKHSPQLLSYWNTAKNTFHKPSNFNNNKSFDKLQSGRGHQDVVIPTKIQNSGEKPICTVTNCFYTPFTPATPPRGLKEDGVVKYTRAVMAICWW